MLTRGAGDIVNTSSESVQRLPISFLGLYAATKSALKPLSSAVRADVINMDIRIARFRSVRLTRTLSWD